MRQGNSLSRLILEIRIKYIEELLVSYHHRTKQFIVAVVMACIASSAYGQLDTSGLWVNIDSVTISASKISKHWLNSTRSISEMNTSKATEISHQISLQDYVNEIPGLFAINSQNKAQDLRIAVRGFGARSAFGIRGVKVIVDGIPETTPDGQAQIDVIPLGIIRKVELIKGPSSVLYGNASGGVLSINTLSESNYNLLAKPLLSGRVSFGSFNTQQYQVSYARKFGKTSYLVHGNQTSSDGYRGQSGYITRNFKARLDHTFSKYSKVNVMVDFLSRPDAQDPGSLSLTEIALDRKQARPLNVQQKTGENLSNFKASFHYSILAGERNKFDAYGFFSSRKFDGALPFTNGGIIDLSRNYFGQGISYTVRSVKNSISSTVKYGYDIANQFDDRKRFENLEGVQGASTMDQKESFKNVGLFIISDVSFGTFDLNGGLRFDHNEIRVQDNFLFGPDGSGSKSYSRFNPSLGFNLELDAATALFANFSTGYDTPTLNELSNNPDTIRGFNRDLEPQSSVSYEVGSRIQLHEQIKAQLALFKIDSRDEIVPYTLIDFPDQTFYRNVGSSERIGIELECNFNIATDFLVSASYAIASYKYKDYQVDSSDYSGNFLPGLPSHNAFLGIEYHHKTGLSVNLQNQLVGSIFLDDANSAKSESFFISNLHLGYRLAIKNYSLQPFLGLKNLLGTQYNDNLRINAFGERYYEPAPGFNFFGGVKFNL